MSICQEKRKVFAFFTNTDTRQTAMQRLKNDKLIIFRENARYRQKTTLHPQNFFVFAIYPLHFGAKTMVIHKNCVCAGPQNPAHTHYNIYISIPALRKSESGTLPCRRHLPSSRSTARFTCTSSSESTCSGVGITSTSGFRSWFSR